MHAVPIGDPGQHRLALLFCDILTCKLAARKLRDSEERQAFLLRLSDELSGLSDPDEDMETMASRIGERLDLSTCVFADIDEARGEIHRASGLERGRHDQPEADVPHGGLSDRGLPARGSGRRGVDHQRCRDAPAGGCGSLGLSAGRVVCHRPYSSQWSVDGVLRRDPSGKVVRIGGIGDDVTEIKDAEDRQQVLVTEPQHRTFNLMTVVRSVAEATAQSSASLQEFKPKFRDRVDALARV